MIRIPVKNTVILVSWNWIAFVNERKLIKQVFKYIKIFVLNLLRFVCLL